MGKLIIFAVILVLAAETGILKAEDYIHLPGKTCEDAPPCPDGRPCVMSIPHCNAGDTCGTDLVPTCASKLLAAETSTLKAEDYVHLPGKTCEDAPPCPDGRPCVMSIPHCNAGGTCGTDPVPTCASKAK